MTMHQPGAKHTKRISKFLSLVLRHRPEKINLNLDSAGWADIDELIAKAKSHGTLELTPETIAHVVATNDKQRFSISQDGSRIRANQGHSIDIELGLEPQVPPAVLYHGTASRFLKSIDSQGLTKRSRQHVHLSAEVGTATTVGSRHGVPVVLTVDAHAMHADGHEFFRSDNGVWITDHVPPRYFSW